MSKRCCPICIKYLDIIQGGSTTNKYLVGGSHDCISPCTLPLWTPLQYLNAMNVYWGRVLRDDLLGLMATDPFQRRQRSKTTGSMGRASNSSIDSSVSSGPFAPHHDLVDTIDDEDASDDASSE